MPKYGYSEITPEILALTELCRKSDYIAPELYKLHDVKRGLRDLDGKGVLTGLTEISEVCAYTYENGVRIPQEGELFYRGYSIENLVKGFAGDNRCGFEEITYLLLFGELPTAKQLEKFSSLLFDYRSLPNSFVRDIIMKAPSASVMNAMARSVLTLYSYDDNADDISIPNVLRQCLQLISLFPMIAVYCYQAYNHYFNGKSLVVHTPKPGLSTAEQILYLLRPDNKFTDFEAKVLDVALVLHMEHGGGNNSTFTNRVVSSSGTDTYSAVAASLGSLKGPRHGGANIKVVDMIEDLKNNVKDWEDEDEICRYLTALLRKQAFDNAGLIYGMGHAIYSISDPRANIFKGYVEQLSKEKGKEADFALYSKVEKLAPQVIAAERKVYKGVSANVDFYSGFVYSMLDLPTELYTPLFAIARIVGWSAHRIEELVGNGKIIRPAYENVAPRRDYKPVEKRDN